MSVRTGGYGCAMFNEVQGLLQRVTSGEVDQTAVSNAAADHVQSADPEQLKQNLQKAADVASQNGQSDLAQQITSMLSRNTSNPQGLKQEAISLITSHPEILQHFEPDVVRNILGRLPQ